MGRSSPGRSTYVMNGSSSISLRYSRAYSAGCLPSAFLAASRRCRSSAALITARAFSTNSCSAGSSSCPTAPSSTTSWLSSPRTIATGVSSAALNSSVATVASASASELVTAETASIVSDRSRFGLWTWFRFELLVTVRPGPRGWLAGRARGPGTVTEKEGFEPSRQGIPHLTP